ncbi:MAG: tetratricopeptide repeat protein, partial [Chloroflexi bacterium]|nr:tetratricopeptide repeat protein [Chloroflexota bacterium]
MNEQARRMVEEGVAAARQGERGQARALLLQATARAPDAFDAWLWLGGIEDDPRQALQYLERAVALQPESVRARRGLEWAQRRVAESGGEPSPPAPASGAPP